MKQPDVLIVGGGFAGLNVASGVLKAGLSVQMISSRADFLFTPLLIDAVSGELSFDVISFPLTKYLKHPNFSFIQEVVTFVDVDSQSVTTNAGTYSGRYLVLAQGSIDREVPILGKEHACHLKTMADAQRAQQFIRQKAEGTHEPLDVSIIGAGVTGIELAFALRSLVARCNHRKVHIRMFNATDQLLPHFTKKTQQYVMRRLEAEGIHLHSNAAVKKIEADAIHVGAQQFSSNITFLTVGVAPNTSMVDSSFRDSKGNIIVNQFLQVPSYPQVLAVGDVITLENWNIPKLAQTAVTQGKHVASNIIRHRKQKKLLTYTPRIEGRLMSLGEWYSVAEVGPWVFRGFFAYLIRVGAYTLKMPGFLHKSKLLLSGFTRKIIRKI